ncbi:MAG: extracellular solute-binding protein [Clostridia bacterium]|nr:extracellular solute-binding protein [Clostridia bacterium]
MSVQRNEKEIVIWHEFDGPGDLSKNVLEEICNDFSNKYGVSIKPEVMSLKEMVERIDSIYITGEGPHMAFVPSDLSLLGKNALCSDVPGKLYKGIIPEKMLQTMNMNGRQFGLPVLGGNHLIMYYNKDILGKAPESWEELEEISGELLSEGFIPASTDVNQSYWLLPILSACGTWPVVDNDSEKLDYSKVKTAFSYIDYLMSKGVISSFNASYEMLDKFHSGDIAAIVNGEWVYDFISGNLGEKLGVCAIPSIKGMNSTPVTSSIGLMFPNNSLESDLRDYLLEFASLMISEECQIRWANGVNRIPLVPSALDKVEKTSTYNRKVVLEQMKAGYPLVPGNKTANTWNVLEFGIDLYWNKRVELDEVIVQMEERAKNLNKKYN